MSKYIIPIGVAWVGVSLVIGLVIAVSSLSNQNGTMVVEEVRTEVYYKEKPEMTNQGTAKVQIENTGPQAEARVEIE